MQKVVERLKELNLKIATMESCTGGAIANAITSIEGASDVLEFSAVTYSNKFKIKLGVNAETIDKYSVYSMEVAHEMAYNIKEFAGSDIGIGVTGKLKRADKNNLQGEDNKVYVSIYYNGIYNDLELTVIKETRKENKEYILNKIIDKLISFL